MPNKIIKFIMKDYKKKLINKENLNMLIFILFIFFIDRFSKIIILDKFSEYNYFVNDYLNLNLIWNTGIGFGIFSSVDNFFYHLITFIIGVIILFLFYLIFTSKIRKEKILFSLIIGGAIGNFYDRVVFRAVPDFIDIHYKNLHWFTFNTADIFISIGVIILMLTRIKEKKEI